MNKPSLRKIRRHRKYFRLMRRVTRQMRRSPAFRKAIHDLVIFGKSEMFFGIDYASVDSDRTVWSKL